MSLVSFVSWKTGRAGFGLFHMTRDNAYTLCGRKPEGIISSRISTPAVEQTCATCRERWVREGEVR